MPAINSAGYRFEKDAIYSPKGGALRFVTPPYEHQLECLRRFADAPYFALLAEMGTGKTWIVINNYAYLLARGLVQNMLVIAPNGVQWNWVRNELPSHLPKRVASQVQYAGYSGGMRKKERVELTALIETAARVPSVLCVNWAALSHDSGMQIVHSFIKQSNELMIAIDESDFCKNPQTKASQAVLKVLAPAAKYKRIMTGTPITNTPYDAWAQFQFLSPDILKCPSYIAFKRRHGVFLSNAHPIVRSIQQRGRGGFPLVPQVDNEGRPIYQKLDLLQEQIKPYSYRVLKADCLDLPEKVYINAYVDLTPKQKAVYSALAKDGLALWDNQEVPIASKIALLSHLCQACGNHFSPSLQAYETGPVNKELMTIDNEHNPKLEKALELVHGFIEQGAKAIIWCRYRAEISDILQALASEGIEAVAYYGEVSKDDRLAACEAFEHGSAMVFVANAQSAGTGLTLVAASYAIYYSNSFSLHDRLQSEDRCHRIGQKAKHVTYIDIIARNTVDERVSMVLKNKGDIASAITSFSAKELFKAL